MIEAYIDRRISDDQGTIGVLRIPVFNWQCYVNELPDRKNERNFSRINQGRYLAKWYNSPKFGYVPLLQNVQGRSGILFHSGNYAGDSRKRWKTDSLGCIMLGEKAALLNGQRAVLNSKSTMLAFTKIMSGKDFYVNIN